MYKLITEVNPAYLVNAKNNLAIETFKDLEEAQGVFKAYSQSLPGLIFAQLEDSDNKIIGYHRSAARLQII